MSDHYLHVDAHNVRIELEKLINAHPALEDDDDLRADMVEGSTDMDAVITRTYQSLRNDEALASGAQIFKSEIDARQKRFEARAQAKRALILDILEAAKLSRRELPIATFSRRNPQPIVEIESVDDLPQGFRRVKVEAARTEIKKALLAGEDVPGARLALGAPSLTIRGA